MDNSKFLIDLRFSSDEDASQEKNGVAKKAEIV